MGAEVALAVGITSLVASAAASTVAILAGRKGNDGSAKPQSLDSFSITKAQEGSPVPLVYGKVRLPGNIIYYGNLRTKKIEAEGGKGGGGQVVGFEYRLDVWQSIAMGQIEIVETYVDGKLEEVKAKNTLFNDGTSTTIFPTQPGNDTNAIPGVSHIFHEKLFLGSNTTVPTIHFIVNRILNTGINNENMANGSNPAAIVLDLLMQDPDFNISQVDLDSFNTAADYWFSKGYGLNLVLNESKTISEHIKDVLSYVDGIFYIDNQGRYAIKAFNPNETPVATMDADNDTNTFVWSRPEETQLPNFFKFTYVDENLEFSERVVTGTNRSSLERVGQIDDEIDLTAFRDRTTASKRATEMTMVESFGALEIEVETNHLGFSHLLPGDIVTITSTDDGIESVNCRVMEIDIPNISSNSNKIKFRQVVETLFTDSFLVAAGSQFVKPDLTLEALDNVRVFELPYNKNTGFEPSYLILAARKKGFETEFVVQTSLDEFENYSTRGIFSTFAQVGTLQAAYPNTTNPIDDTLGVLYSTDDFDPEFISVSRKELFSKARFAIIGNEIIQFQFVNTEGNNYRLSGCVRGVLNTPIESHANGSEIWIVDVADNILESIESSNFYVKVLPAFQDEIINAASVTAVNVVSTQKAKTPRNPTRLLATRSGSDIDIQIFPNTPDIPGFGSQTLNNTIFTSAPYQFEGDFEVSYNSTKEIFETDKPQINVAGSVDVTVKHRRFNLFSSGITVTVGASDGEYLQVND